jgi:hypothetical protein
VSLAAERRGRDMGRLSDIDGLVFRQGGAGGRTPAARIATMVARPVSQGSDCCSSEFVALRHSKIKRPKADSQIGILTTLLREASSLNGPTNGLYIVIFACRPVQACPMEYCKPPWWPDRPGRLEART